MGPGPPLPPEFFARPCLEVAPELLGAYLVRRLPGGRRLSGRIVEVEAYRGGGVDPGSHAHVRETPRNRVMFGPPGHLYVYRSYGIHVCANVVCEPAGRSAAVLFRALEPVQGLDAMRVHRDLPADAPARAVASGPGNLTRALGITLDDYGRSLLHGPLQLRGPGESDAAVDVASSARIGLSNGAELPYRFYARGSPFVSRGRPGPRAPRRSAS